MKNFIFKNKWLSIFLIPFILIIGYLLSNQIKYPEVRWNWDEIEVSRLDFPKGFQWGVATAAHQVEGNSINNWSRWEEGTFQDGRPHIHKGEKSGLASDHWNRYKEDILLIKELGVDVYRFSEVVICFRFVFCSRIAVTFMFCIEFAFGFLYFHRGSPISIDFP